MKKILFVSLVCLLCSVSGTYAQSFESLSECKSSEDTLRYLQHIFVEPKDKFVGKPAKEVIEAFRKIWSIKDVTCDVTSPWIDEEGLSYVKALGLYYYELFGRPEKGKQIYFHIHFENTYAEIDSFKKRIPKEDRNNYDRYVGYFQYFIVKEIRIYIWDWDKRKKIE